MRQLVRSDDQLHFGFMVNGMFTESTNFGVELLYCVETNLPTGPGYIARVTRASDQVSGECFFLQKDTKDSPTFTNAINLSWKNGGGLFCQLVPREMYQLMSMLDRELRLKPNYAKHLVEVAGHQPDGTIAINPDLYLSQNGEEIGRDHRYVWVPDWPGAPGPLFYRHPATPYSLQPLTDFLRAARTTMQENFSALMLGLGAMVSMWNFKGIHKEIGHFNLPVMYGPPMSGKTLAASCVGLVTGMNKNQISSRNTQAFLAEVFVMSSMPFLWDDPTRETEVRQVCIDLGNAAFRGKFKEDAKVPLTGCLVTANFNLAEIEKYYSRISLIPFKKIDKVNEVGEGPELERKAMAASSALPSLISLANHLKKEDITETVTTLRQDGTTVDLRVIEGVAVPFFMAHKILQTCGLETTSLKEYCHGIVVSHHRPTTNNVENGTASSLEESLLAARDIDVTTVLRVYMNRIYVIVKEYRDLVGVDLMPEMKRRGILTSKSSFRFPRSDGESKVIKCAIVKDATDRELSLAKDLLNPPQLEDEAHPQLEEAQPQPQPDEAVHQPDEAVHQRDEAQPRRNEAQPQLDEARHQRDEAQPRRNEAQPQLDEAIHQLDEAQPRRNEAQPQLDEARHQLDEAQPQRDKAQLRRDEAQPQREEAQPPQDLPQSPARPTPARRNPTPAHRNPTPAQRNPTPSRRNPTPARRNPTPARQLDIPEPQTDHHPTQQDEPQTHLDIPRPNQDVLQPKPKRVIQPTNLPETQPVYSVTQTEKNSLKFVGRKIAHTWTLNGKKKIYQGEVVKAVKGRDGAKKTTYRVEYTNGDVETINLRKDFDDGCVKFL